MRKLMLSTAFTSLAATVVLGLMYNSFDSKVLLALTITFGTVFYHFAMRLAVGLIVNAVFHNNMNHKRAWFDVKKTELKLYKKLKIRQWKKLIPTYLPETFDIESKSLDCIIGATCQAEVVHEIIILLSFVPIIFSVWFHELTVFILTSVVAALIDSVFVILQRYNRPRLIALQKKRGIPHGNI